MVQESVAEQSPQFLTEDSSHLHALATMVKDRTTGGEYGRTDLRRPTSSSQCRAACVARLYTPASHKHGSGRPLGFVSPGVLYGEAPVCHECYQVSERTRHRTFTALWSSTVARALLPDTTEKALRVTHRLTHRACVITTRACAISLPLLLRSTLASQRSGRSTRSRSSPSPPPPPSA